MNDRKQSFLERLTGAQVIEEGSLGRGLNGRQVSGVRSSVHVNQAEIDRNQSQYRDDDTREARQEDEDEADTEASLAIDMYESDHELVIQVMIAGVTTDDLQIAITRDAVTIKGRRVPPRGIPEDNYLVRELYWGAFSREIALPFEIETDGAEAVEKYGLLIIRLPKLDQNRMQELKVKSL